jgi:hypothetical protein
MHELLSGNEPPRVFSESALKNRLSRLSPRARSVFAWSCSARLFAGYIRWHEETGSVPDKFVHNILVDVRDRLFNPNEGELFPELSNSIDILDGLTPDEESEWSPSHPIAQDAVASLAYTLGSMATGGSQESTWAARRAYEAADQLAMFELAPGRTEYPEESKVLSHSAVQTELARQESNLEMIEHGNLDAVLRSGTAYSIFDY